MTPKLKLNANLNWTKRTVESLFDLKKGQMLEKEALVSDGKYEYFNGGIKNSGRTDQFNTYKNTLSVIIGGSCGFVRFCNKDYFCGQSNCSLSLLDPLEIDLKFAYYALKSQEERLAALATGTTIKNIRLTDLKNFEIPFVKSLKEQKTIAYALDVYDQRIEALTGLIEINRSLRNEYAQKLFELDPEFLAHWKLTALAEQMSSICLEEIFNLKSGKHIKSEERFAEGKYPYFGAGIESTSFAEEPNTKSNTISIISNGYSIGTVRYHSVPYFNGTGSIALEPLNSKIYVPFFYCGLKYIQAQIKENAKRDDSPFISLKIAGNIKVPYVQNFELQRSAGKIIFLLDQKLEDFKNEREILITIRDSLMNKLFPSLD